MIGPPRAGSVDAAAAQLRCRGWPISWPGSILTAQHRLLVELVCTHITTVLGLPETDSIDPDRAFQDLGFDSLTALELRNRLKTATGLALSPTLIFDYPTPTTVAGHLGEQLAGGDGQALVSVDKGADEVGEDAGTSR